MIIDAALSGMASGAPRITQQIMLHDLLDASMAAHQADNELSAGCFRRNARQLPDGLTVLDDGFSQAGASCHFIRCGSEGKSTLTLSLVGAYVLKECPSGGWWLEPSLEDQPVYWIPVSPVHRSLDNDGHILSEVPIQIIGLSVTPTGLSITLKAVPSMQLDLAIWRFAARACDLVRELAEPLRIELQPVFLWSSHTTYAQPSDFYRHLIFGHVYENHAVWPKYWRVCSELDAYALYVTLSGLMRSTRKRLYSLLRTQIVFSVIARQAEDGGWYHGEWTEEMESHFRLHAGAMHMLASYFEETGDLVVQRALEKAAAFAAAKTDHIKYGTWYLHDSLEASAETLKRYPFRSKQSRVLDKSPTNLLVLNTHLDTNIAMERYRRVTGDARYDTLIASARAATNSVISLRPAESLYRLLYWAIGLTFLPASRASALPLALRAIKRIAWKYLIPRLPHIKAMFPRLVMPGGYIERELTMFAFSVRYLPVNLMDLVRTRRLFDEVVLDPVLETSFAFTQSSGITRRWKEAKGKEDDSLGFWAEALYHLCLCHPDRKYRAWLAESMLDLEDNQLGLSPSLLGANGEAIAPEQQCPCPSPLDARFRVANLSRGHVTELLIVNPSRQTLTVEWQIPPAMGMTWSAPDGSIPPTTEGKPDIPARSWIRGVSIQSETPWKAAPQNA